MKYTNVFEKLLCIFDLVSGSWIDIAFIVIAAISLVLLAIKKISKKRCFLLVFLSCLCLFLYTIYQYFEPLSIMMNSLIDNLFTTIYFPSTYAYLFTLIVTDIVTIANLLNPKVEKTYKTIHGICFIIINFILTLVLEMIAKYNIDIFSKKSLFSNTDFITLLEFSMNIFIVWLASLFIVYLINTITEHIIIAKERKVLKTNPVKILVPEITISNDELKEEYNKVSDTIEVPTTEPKFIPFIPDTTTNHFIPTIATDAEVKPLPNAYHFEKETKTQPIPEVKTPTYQYTAPTSMENTFDLSAFIPKKQEVSPIQSMTNQTDQIFDQILKNETFVDYGESIKSEKDSYTLNDYRIFNKMLKDIREHNESNSISIDKNLEYRLITKYSTETYHMFQKMLKIYSN